MKRVVVYILPDGTEDVFDIAETEDAELAEEVVAQQAVEQGDVLDYWFEWRNNEAEL